jgi:hypothetical protein
VASATPRPLYPRKKTRYPLYMRLGGPQGRSGRVRKISTLTGIRSPDRLARSIFPRNLLLVRILSQIIPSHAYTLAVRLISTLTYICTCVYQLVSFFQVSPPKFCVQFCSVPCVPHDSLTNKRYVNIIPAEWFCSTPLLSPHNTIHSMTAKITYRVGYARTNVTGSRTSFVIAFFFFSIQ